MKNIAIIPARGGSKRIPRKNVKDFCGKPMLAYSIEAAHESKLFDAVIISTDDPEIADVGKQYGAEVPFVRPASLANDFAGTDAVFLHAIEELAGMGRSYDYACCIYATAPLLQPEFLKRGYEIVKSGAADSAFSVTTYPYPIFRSLKINDQGFVDMLWPEYRMTRSQDLPEVFHDAGQFYWVQCESYLRERKIWGARTQAVVLPRKWVQDIDTPEDWEIAEEKYRIIKQRTGRDEI